MEMFRTLYTFPKITISKVKGPAFAGGCGLAGLCDFTFGTAEAKFAYTEVKIGFIPAIVSVFLSDKIGENAARRMLLTGEILNAERALQIGLLSELFGKDEIDSAVGRFAADLCVHVSSESVKLSKELLVKLRGLSLDEQLNLASAYNAAARGTNDCKKGIYAFLNKEKLSW